MIYYGKLHLTNQKLTLLLVTAVLLVISSLLVWINSSLVYWCIPATITPILIYADLLFSEKRSGAFILANEIIINRVLAFGLFIYTYRKRLTNEEAEAIKYFLDTLESKGSQSLSVAAINKLVHADIIFYRN